MWVDRDSTLIDFYKILHTDSWAQNVSWVCVWARSLKAIQNGNHHNYYLKNNILSWTAYHFWEPPKFWKTPSKSRYKTFNILIWFVCTSYYNKMVVKQRIVIISNGWSYSVILFSETILLFSRTTGPIHKLFVLYNDPNCLVKLHRFQQEEFELALILKSHVSLPFWSFLQMYAFFSMSDWLYT